MTASEWQTCDRPDDMLNAVRDQIPDRKLLLFACACCRLAGPSFPGGGGTSADLIERILDAKQQSGGRRTIFDAVAGSMTGNVSALIAQSLAISGEGSWMLARQVSQLCRQFEIGNQHIADTTAAEWQGIRSKQADLLRELLGDPFGFTFDPAWRSETVAGIAVGIEADRAWDRMPILADALQDAGCDDASVLGHCREDRRHFRGCWVVDGCVGR